MEIHPEWFQAAKVSCCRDYPYINEILWQLEVHQRPGLNTMAADDQFRMYYDPNLNWAPKEAGTVIFHECLHVLLQHGDRARVHNATAYIEAPDPIPETWPRDQNGNPLIISLWNIAGDLAINTKLANYPHPKDRMIYPKMYSFKDDLTAEEYYELLLKKNPPKQQIRVDCGSCADGNKRDYEKPGPGRLSKTEQDMVRKVTAEAVAKYAGDTPGGLKEWAESILNPKIPWTRILARILSQSMEKVAGQQDYSYSRPNRHS